MTFELLGMVGTRDASETHGDYYGTIDPDYLTRFARAHEDAGFDRVLIPYGATGPDPFPIASHVLNATTRLKVAIAHRPGFIAPTLVARKLATLDHLTGGGRVAIHHISGGDEADQKREGDFVDHDRRYARTAEFMGLLRRLWESTEPFDHSGEFYRLEGAFTAVKPATPEGIPLFFGGASPPAVETGTRHADVYMLWGEPRQRLAERIAELREAAAAHGRTLGFSLSVRPIVADTEDAAWERAERIRAATAARVGQERPFRMSTSVGSARLQEQAAESERHDERLWYGITALTGPGGNSTALVGTPEQVAESLDAYRRLGIDTILIRGFDPLEDVVDWGHRLVPLLRAGDAALV